MKICNESFSENCLKNEQSKLKSLNESTADIWRKFQALFSQLL